MINLKKRPTEYTETITIELFKPIRRHVTTVDIERRKNETITAFNTRIDKIVTEHYGRIVLNKHPYAEEMRWEKKSWTQGHYIQLPPSINKELYEAQERLDYWLSEGGDMQTLMHLIEGRLELHVGNLTESMEKGTNTPMKTLARARGIKLYAEALVQLTYLMEEN